MIKLVLLSLVLTALFMFSKSVWNRLLSLSSLGVKISVLIALFAFVEGLDYMLDIAVLYSIVSGAGMMIVLALLIKGEME